jgi:hypothetical protein
MWICFIFMSHPASEDNENNVAFKIPDGPTQKQSKIVACQTPRTYVAVSVYLGSTDLPSFFYGNSSPTRA